MNLELGTVTAVDPAKRKVKVKNQRTGTQSGWLNVLQRDGAGLEPPSDNRSTGIWLPRVNDTVLVAYLPVFQGDGYVLGRVP